MIKAVIFDSDGMLSHGPRFNETYAREKGIPLERLTPFFTGPFQDCIVGKADLREELAKGWLDKWEWEGSVEDLLEYWFSVGDKLDVEVLSTVSQIRVARVPCVLATNQEKYRTKYLSDAFGYDTVFDKVFSSAEVGHKKPEDDFFAAVENYFRETNPLISRSEILFWDDDDKNIEGASRYGFTVKRFENAEQYKDEMRGLGFVIG